MKHLLVTNDFPPKVGGIQSYLWELWRRLPADEVTVVTTTFPGAEAWDAAQGFRVERLDQRVLLPTPAITRRIDAMAADAGAEIIIIDPALPLGAVGPRLDRPYGLVLHGAEVTVPGRLPLTASALRRVLQGADLVIAAGSYPAAEASRVARRTLPVVNVPPGVDIDRFVPLDAGDRAAARDRHGLPGDALVVLGVSRQVPRKGFDVLIRAAARLAPTHPELLVALAGAGRDRRRLQRIAAATGAPVRFIGRVPDDDLPGLYGSADAFAMLCRNRWLGLEQEGFGIVFLEAAAAGVAQIAGASGGSAEAVAHGQTGLVVDRPSDVGAVAAAIARLAEDPAERAAMGAAARQRAVAEFAYDALATRLGKALGMPG